MSAMSISAHFFLFCVLFFSISTKRVSSSAEYLYHDCGSNTSTYTPNSAYQSNLNQLLHTLSSNATQDEDGFNKDAVGQGLPDSVFGLFLCRGDVNTDVCGQCVGDATTEISQRCPNRKEATIWYDECMLRYSDRSIDVPKGDFLSGVSTHNVRNASGKTYNFINALADTFNETTRQAANRFSSKRFATIDADFTAIVKLYTLAQCIPDLYNEDCEYCLQNATSRLPYCCDFSQGATIISPWCNIRYEIYPFYYYANATPSTPAPSNKQGKPIQKDTSNSGISRQGIIAIVVPIAVSLVVLLVGLRILTGRMMRKKRHGTIKKGNDENEISIVESLQYDFKTIQLATTSFSADNKIGEGGFGDVYKGTLSDNREIAVKRLSKSSGQGAKEFKNEIVLVAKLQHRNLVRLLGFCLEGEEKIIVYEFVPNKSLDSFLFG